MSEDISVRENSDDKKYTYDIRMADNYYSASITVNVLDESLDKIDMKDLMDAITKHKIVYGIDYNVINKVLKNPKAIQDVVFARGVEHKNGEDGFIDYYFNTDFKSAPKLLEDGTVNHKELKEIQQVRKNEILAKITPPTAKQDGITVTGRKISGKPGYYPKLRGGKNVTVSEDGLMLFSSVNGVVELDNNRLSVKKVYEVSHDVGVSTGNVSYDGKIIVRGNVEYGYSVESNDDIEIYGLVEGAKITGKNVTVHKGIHNNSIINASGEVRALYIENGDITAEGDVCSDTILHSTVKCKGSITVDIKKGLIIGGIISARKGIKARVVGSHIGSKTRINIGIDDELMSDLKAINISQKRIEDEVNKINKSIDIASRRKGSNISLKLQIEKQLKLKQDRIDELKRLELAHKDLCELADSLKNVRLICEDIYPGTNLRINNSHYNLKRKLKNVSFIKEDGEVKIYTATIR